MFAANNREYSCPGHREGMYHVVIAVWSTKEAESPASETVLGNHRRQPQQSRLELGLHLSRGF